MSFGGKERIQNQTFLSFVYILRMPHTFGTSLLTALPHLWRKNVPRITSYF
jgi:hypothetical protein